MRNLILFILMFIPSIGVAGEGNGLVTWITVNRFDQVVFAAENRTNKPTCATGDRFAVSLTTENGKAIYAMLLAAKAQNQEVNILGQNNCDIRAEFESAQYVEVKTE